VHVQKTHGRIDLTQRRQIGPQTGVKAQKLNIQKTPIYRSNFALIVSYE